MDDELLELQRQFEFAQQAKSSIRLSERNVVELVQKLQELRILDFELLHTVTGKEYITPEHLRREILAEIEKLGRISLIDLADTIGVDLYYIEKQAEQIISDDPRLTLIQGEIISQSYWDSVAEEINERLQESSQIALAEIAAELQVGSELLASMLDQRLGTLVKGRLEGGQLYTPAYVARVSAMVRGATRAITVPTNLTVIWSSLQQILQGIDGASGIAVDGSFFQSLFNAIVKENEILGSLRAGVHWTPNIFSIAQKESIDSFFSQNSVISYDFLRKLGIPNPIQFLQSRYPDGIPLSTTFIHPSIIEMLDSTVEDILERGSWTNSLLVLPSSFEPQDASKILLSCPSVQVALKSNKALIFGDSFIFSNIFIKDLYGRMEKEMETINVPGSSTGISSVDSLSSSKFGNDPSMSAESIETGNDIGKTGEIVEKKSKKKKGKSFGNTQSIAADGALDDHETSMKSKKNQRKAKATSNVQVAETKAGGKKESVKAKENNINYPTEEWVIEKIKTLIPDLEEHGIDDPAIILQPLVNHLRPMLNNSWKERRKALFTENAEKMKRLLDNTQQKLDEPFLNLQLYEKALDLFEDDQSISVILHRHLLRTTAAPIVDMLFHNLDLYKKLKNGIEVAELQNSESVSLNTGERTTIAKSFPGSLSNKAVTAAEALEGKRVETFISALGDLVEESGLILKKLDKKLERTLLHSYRKELTSQVSAEMDPIALLPKVVSLLYIQIHHKALQAPGRAISVAISRLKDKLDDSAFKILSDYQTATVTLLSLISAAVGDEDDCSSDRILTKREFLESQIPALKGLVSST
ncbi:E3 UFM1-protein ligase 1 homolog isoform X1 [Benincasa hispida]|uniref:E3 UFM1-protein ligase 1 homolog isoform X1 n=1 Tax=Benincasa hispida TaxID=102211 RepID=UPI0018FFC411|nr:E3 UFM1-protein ligase 1 homolog isoform X1 [Benincasa hispida]